jgi:hypothetical protein
MSANVLHPAHALSGVKHLHIRKQRAFQKIDGMHADQACQARDSGNKEEK